MSVNATVAIDLEVIPTRLRPSVVAFYGTNVLNRTAPGERVISTLK